MKKIILLLTFTLLFSCSKDDNSNSSNNNNNGNSFTNSMDYEFTITINGEVHKVKGNTRDWMPSGSGNGSNVINYPNVYKVVMMSIDDVTASDYISGQNLSCYLQLPNLLLGVNQANVSFSGSYFSTLFTSLGSTAGVSWHTVSGPKEDYYIINKLPIIITDLGTTGKSPTYTGYSYNFGETVKGNYSGTIYLSNHFVSNYSSTRVYDIPVQLSIDFKALRMY